LPKKRKRKKEKEKNWSRASRGLAPRRSEWR
jgi:hypothetical protein